MSENPTGGASNERDPLEEFIKKMQEQGFDPSAGATGQGGKDASNAQNPFGALFGEGGQNPFGISIDRRYRRCSPARAHPTAPAA